MESSQFWTVVGRNIRRQRRWQEMSQAQLAERLATQQMLISVIESGHVGIATETLDAIAAALGVDRSQLLPADEEAA